MKEVNAVKIGINHDIMNEFFQMTIEHCFPRMDDGKFERDHGITKPPWSIPISIFKDYRIDTEALLNKCFEYDWSCCKLPKLGDEEAAVKEEMRKGYRIIKENYKTLSAIGRVGSVFGIQWLLYNEFVCNKIKLVDGVEIKLQASDLLFKMMNGRPKIGTVNPSLSLVRFEFMEVLMRLTIQRYFDTKKVPTRGDAVKLLFAEHLNKYSGGINSQLWREGRFWNEECDNIFKANWSLMQHIYLTRGGSKKMPGEKTYCHYLDSWILKNFYRFTQILVLSIRFSLTETF